MTMHMSFFSFMFRNLVGAIFDIQDSDYGFRILCCVHAAHGRAEQSGTWKSSTQSSNYAI